MRSTSRVGTRSGGRISDPANRVDVVPNSNGQNPSWAGTGCHWGDNGGLITLPAGSPYNVTDDCAFQTSGSNGGTSDDTATDHLTWTSSGPATTTGNPPSPTVPAGVAGPWIKKAKHRATAT